MDSFKRKIGIGLIIVIIICCICVIGLYMLHKNVSEIDINNKVESDEKVEYLVEKLRDPSKFFSVQTCIQDNLNENFTAIEMNVLEENIISSYSVYGTAKNNTEVYYIVRVDMENKTFLIEELDSDCDSFEKVNLETNIQEIENNGKNTFKSITVSDEEICRIYFEQFSRLELEDAEKAYSLLEEEYKKERFPTFHEYQEYIEDYQYIIENSVLAKYSVNHYEDYTECVLVDIYNNSYILDVTSVMNYTIKLDNYTIKVDNYIDNYKKLKDRDKVQSNVYVFLQMINTKDYKHAYALLDDNFKSSNFETLEKFKKYVQNNFFPYNLNASSATIKEEGNYYIYETTIKENSSSAAEAKKLSIIMKLEEGTDFVMSFSIE